MKRFTLHDLVWPGYVSLLFIVAGATFFVELFMHTHGAAKLLAADTRCLTTHSSISIDISNQDIRPQQIYAHECDQLVFNNISDNLVQVAIGTHDALIAYPGLGTATLRPRAQQRLLLTAKGTFPIHDHLHDTPAATLTVVP